MKIDEVKWELVAGQCLGLVGTHIEVVFGFGNAPFHVHRGMACVGAFDSLAEAKTRAIALVNELMEMGVDP
jgi:hypothetical protein